MGVRRNSIGQMKRSPKGNRSARRAHLVGAARKMEMEGKTPESFGKKMSAKLHGALGHVYVKQEDKTWKWMPRSRGNSK